MEIKIDKVIYNHVKITYIDNPDNINIQYSNPNAHCTCDGFAFNSLCVHGNGYSLNAGRTSQNSTNRAPFVTLEVNVDRGDGTSNLKPYALDEEKKRVAVVLDDLRQKGIYLDLTNAEMKECELTHTVPLSRPWDEYHRALQYLLLGCGSGTQMLVEGISNDNNNHILESNVCLETAYRQITGIRGVKLKIYNKTLELATHKQIILPDDTPDIIRVEICLNEKACKKYFGRRNLTQLSDDKELLSVWYDIMSQIKPIYDKYEKEVRNFFVSAIQEAYSDESPKGYATRALTYIHTKEAVLLSPLLIERDQLYYAISQCDFCHPHGKYDCHLCNDEKGKFRRIFRQKDYPPEYARNEETPLAELKKIFFGNLV